MDNYLTHAVLSQCKDGIQRGRLFLFRRGLMDRRKDPLKGPFELFEVGVSQFFSERGVEDFGLRGDSHPNILALQC